MEDLRRNKLSGDWRVERKDFGLPRGDGEKSGLEKKGFAKRH